MLLYAPEPASTSLATRPFEARRAGGTGSPRAVGTHRFFEPPHANRKRADNHFRRRPPIVRAPLLEYRDQDEHFTHPQRVVVKLSNFSKGGRLGSFDSPLGVEIEFAKPALRERRLPPLRCHHPRVGQAGRELRAQRIRPALIPCVHLEAVSTPTISHTNTRLEGPTRRHAGSWNAWRGASGTGGQTNDC
jgi:hypothetical protein